MRKCKLDNKELLEETVKHSINYSDVLSKMGYDVHSGLYKTLYFYLNKFGINDEHLKNGKKQNKQGKPSNLDKILNNEIKYKNSHNLKDRLYKEGLKERKCELCGQGEEWNGMKISLILDHINGKHWDNELINLRIVCPNCDAGLPTFKGRNVIHNSSSLEKRKKQILESNINFLEKGWKLKLSQHLKLSEEFCFKLIKQIFPDYKEKFYLGR